MPVSEISEERLTPPSTDREVGVSQIALLTGCQDRPYAFGLAMSLVAKGVSVDVIGGDEIDSPEFQTTRGLRFLNLRGSQNPRDTFIYKLWKLLLYYARLIRYAAQAKPKIFHILWNNKFEYFDRTALMVYYKLQGKKIAFTAHNVNQARRDRRDSPLNRLTLKVQYRLADMIFVHTEKMKSELVGEFGVQERTVSVIPYPVNGAFPDTGLAAAEAKKRLGLKINEKAVLFLGRIKPYKGLEYLLDAFREVVVKHDDYRLIIAGEPKKGSEAYLAKIRSRVSRDFKSDQVISKIEFIPDDKMELYLKAADVLVLPYKEIFQSGVLFLAFTFGLPVIASDVGSFKEEIVDGKTGFLCNPADPAGLANTIDKYFASALYRDLESSRLEIRERTNRYHGDELVAQLTLNSYAEMLKPS